jgi:Tfp pilus assembly protein PilV
VDTPTPHSNEAGFGLIELLMAMLILNVALLALVATFSNGIFTTTRAGNVGTATTLADQQLETYRLLAYDAIGLDTTQAGDSTYTAANPGTNVAPTGAYSCASGGNIRTNFPIACIPSRIVDTSTTPAAPDGDRYRVDTYVNVIAATPTTRATKLVTVIVRDGANLTASPFAKQTTVFDCATGKEPANATC